MKTETRAGRVMAPDRRKMSPDAAAGPPSIAGENVKMREKSGYIRVITPDDGEN